MKSLLKAGVPRHGCAWPLCSAASLWLLSMRWVGTRFPGTKASVTSSSYNLLFPSLPRYTLIDKSEREDKQLGELHADQPGRDSKEGPCQGTLIAPPREP